MPGRDVSIGLDGFFTPLQENRGQDDHTCHRTVQKWRNSKENHDIIDGSDDYDTENRVYDPPFAAR